MAEEHGIGCVASAESASALALAPASFPRCTPLAGSSPPCQTIMVHETLTHVLDSIDNAERMKSH